MRDKRKTSRPTDPSTWLKFDAILPEPEKDKPKGPLKPELDGEITPTPLWYDLDGGEWHDDPVPAGEYEGGYAKVKPHWDFLTPRQQKLWESAESWGLADSQTRQQELRIADAFEDMYSRGFNRILASEAQFRRFWQDQGVSPETVDKLIEAKKEAGEELTIVQYPWLNAVKEGAKDWKRSFRQMAKETLTKEAATALVQLGKELGQLYITDPVQVALSPFKQLSDGLFSGFESMGERHYSDRFNRENYPLIFAVTDHYGQTYNISTPQGRAILTNFIQHRFADFVADASVILPAAKAGVLKTAKLGERGTKALNFSVFAAEAMADPLNIVGEGAGQIAEEFGDALQLGGAAAGETIPIRDALASLGEYDSPFVGDSQPVRKFSKEEIFAKGVEGRFRRVTITPDKNSKGIIEGDPNSFFGSPGPAATRRFDYLQQHPEEANIVDYEDLQEFMRYLENPGTQMKQGDVIESWWTEDGWNEYGKPMFEKAEELGLNPKIMETDTLTNLFHLDKNQVVRRVDSALEAPRVPTKAEIETWDADPNVFYRIGDKNENPLEVNSALDLDGMGWEQKQGLSDAQKRLQEQQAQDSGYDVYWNDDGHEGPGLYYTGPNGTATWDEIQSYTKTINRDEALFIIRGDDGGRLISDDGVMIENPTEIIAKIDSETYNKMGDAPRIPTKAEIETWDADPNVFFRGTEAPESDLSKIQSRHGDPDIHPEGVFDSSVWSLYRENRASIKELAERYLDENWLDDYDGRVTEDAVYDFIGEVEDLGEAKLIEVLNEVIDLDENSRWHGSQYGSGHYGDAFYLPGIMAGETIEIAERYATALGDREGYIHVLKHTNPTSSPTEVFWDGTAEDGYLLDPNSTEIIAILKVDADGNYVRVDMED